MNSLLLHIALFSCFFQFANAISHQSHHSVKNTMYRVLVFNRKQLPKMLKKWSGSMKNQYNDTLFRINKYIFEFNTLSEDDQILIEFIISNML